MNEIRHRQPLDDDLVEKILKPGFDYGYFSGGKTVEENKKRREKAKAEILSLLQGKG